MLARGEMQCSLLFGVAAKWQEGFSRPVLDGFVDDRVPLQHSLISIA